MRNNYTLVSLKRWSAKVKEIPNVATIKAIHVYDFDNTLFSSPLPNPQLWNQPTIGTLQTYEAFAHGGWWHDPSILMATGEGIEKEESRAWESWWNETVVDLVRSSMEQKEVLTVLLTGRGETNFADLIVRMCIAKKLDFDLISLKPETGPAGQRFESTMLFKQEFLKDMVFTYKNADEIRIYEDRPKHVKGFREYFEKLNKSFLSHPVDQPAPLRKPINAEVIHVCELKSALNPETEVEIIQRVINRHNQTIGSGALNPHGAPRKRYKINENFVYFGYMISQIDSARLITLCNVTPNLIDSGEVRFMASSILISPFYPRKDILKKVGGRGKKVTWQVTGISKFEDRIWAVRVAPISDVQVHTQDPTPVVLLAIRKGSRPIDAAKISNWQPVAPEKAFMFETTVGDKVMLKIEEQEGAANQHGGGGYGRNRSKFNNNSHNNNNHNDGGDGGNVHKRKHDNDGEGFFSSRNKENLVNRGNMERDDGTWINPNNNNSGGGNKQNHTGGGGGGGGDRHGQGRYFNQSKQQFNNKPNRTVSGNTGKTGGGNRSRASGGGQGGSSGGGGTGNQRPRGGNRGPAYKSLDDYGPGNFDGAGESKGDGGSGTMEMNY